MIASCVQKWEGFFNQTHTQRVIHDEISFWNVEVDMSSIEMTAWIAHTHTHTHNAIGMNSIWTCETYYQ